MFDPMFDPVHPMLCPMFALEGILTLPDVHDRAIVFLGHGNGNNSGNSSGEGMHSSRGGMHSSGEGMQTLGTIYRVDEAGLSLPGVSPFLVCTSHASRLHACPNSHCQA